jgi:hypothetical protein
VESEKPYLGFDLRFHANYRVTLPISMLADAGKSLDILIRVTAGSHELPVYLMESITVPHFPPEAKGLGWLAGGFDVGPGRYQVDWMMHDGVGRACGAHWDLDVKPRGRERNVTFTLAESTVAETLASPFEDGPPPMPSGQPLRVKILLNLSPGAARESLLNPQYAAVLLSMLRSIVRETSISRLSLVAFNLRAQKILYQRDEVEQIDFATLGQVVQTPSAGTIDYRLLQDRQSQTHFVTHLLIDHLGGKAHSQDAIIIVGPKVSLERKLSLEMLRAGGAAPCPIFYLNYDPNPVEEPFADTIGSALKAYTAASKYNIVRPGDFGAAMSDMLLRLGKRPTGETPFSK